MKIIEQSHKLLEDQADLVQQIGSRAAICYQADGDTPEANIKRVQHCLKNGHNSALEMGRITIDTEVPWEFKNNFIEIGEGMTSASVRGWRELFCKDSYPRQFVEVYPELFGDKPAEDIGEFSIIENPTDSLYHTYRAVQLITNRAMTHEKVRHRPCSFLQESQRYVRYDKPGGIEFIRPLWFSTDRAMSPFTRENISAEYLWEQSMSYAEDKYCRLLNHGLQPQQARGVLPNDTKTEIIVYASLAEWRHIFYQRTQGGADPMMKALMRPVLEEMRGLYPGVFDELKPSVAGR